MTDDITKNLTDSEKLDFLINAVSDIRQRQTALEQLVYERLHDTRPLWQTVIQQIEQIKQELEQIRAHQKRHDEKFTQVLQQISVLNDDVLLVRAGHRELRQRVALLEAA